MSFYLTVWGNIVDFVYVFRHDDDIKQSKVKNKVFVDPKPSGTKLQWGKSCKKFIFRVTNQWRT